MKKLTLTLLACSPFILAGCGGSGSNGSTNQTTYVSVTVNGKQQSNLVLTSGYLASGKYQHHDSEQHHKRNSSDNQLVITYQGAYPAFSNTSDGITFAVTGPTTDFPSGQICTVKADIFFDPTKADESTQASFFNNLLKVKAYVPFRMFAIEPDPTPSYTNVVVSTPNQSNFHYIFSTIDSDGEQFNSALMPSKMELHSTSIDQHITGIIDDKNNYQINIYQEGFGYPLLLDSNINDQSDELHHIVSAAATNQDNTLDVNMLAATEIHNNRTAIYKGSLHYSSATSNNPTYTHFTSVANIPEMASHTAAFQYNTYLTSGTAKIQPPQGKLVYISENPNKTTLNVLSPASNNADPSDTTIDLSPLNSNAEPLAFACSDTDITANRTLSNHCYLFVRVDTTNNNTFDTKYQYKAYRIDDFNPNSGTAFNPVGKFT